MIANSSDFTPAPKPPAPPEMLAELRRFSGGTKQRRFLVTGSSGYIGRHVVRILRAGGHEVCGFDLERHPEDARPYVVGDVACYEHLARAVDQAQPDVILHLAGRSSPRNSSAAAIEYYGTNVSAALNILSLADAGRFAGRVVFASSCAVYGNAGREVKETARPFPVSTYGRAKIAVEEMFTAACASGMFKGAINLRLFNVAGASRKDPRRPAVGDSTPSRLVPSVIDALLNDEPALIRYHRQGGHIRRDFVHVEDAADAFRLAAELLATGEADQATALNIGGPEGNAVSIDYLAEIIARVAGRPLRSIARPAGDYDPCHITADSAMAARVIGYKPLRGLESIAASAWEHAAEIFNQEQQG